MRMFEEIQNRVKSNGLIRCFCSFNKASKNKEMKVSYFPHYRAQNTVLDSLMAAALQFSQYL